MGVTSEHMCQTSNMRHWICGESLAIPPCVAAGRFHLAPKYTAALLAKNIFASELRQLLHEAQQGTREELTASPAALRLHLNKVII